VYTQETLAIVDILTKTVSYSQTLPFIVNGVVSDGSVDYVTTNDYELYACSGLQFEKIAERQTSIIV
jgi:hypothetical protein